MRGAAPFRDDLRAVADGHRLHRRDRDDRLSEPAVEPAVPLGVGAETGRHARRAHGDHAAEGVAVAPRGFDGFDHP